MSTQTHSDPTDRCNAVTNPPQPWPTYSPPACWEEDFLAQRKLASKYVPPIWLPAKTLGTPALVDIPSRIPDLIEFKVLHYYQVHLRSIFADEAIAQDQGFHFAPTIAAPLLCLVGGPTTAVGDALVSVLQLANGDARAVVAQQKLLFNRARPYQIDETISSLFTPPPAHPSYPSGHSTQSYTIAFLIAELISAATDPNGRLAGVPYQVLGLARAIATNREIAGVHYPSDTHAGIQLARRVVDRYLADQAFCEEQFTPLVEKLNATLASLKDAPKVSCGSSTKND